MKDRIRKVGIMKKGYSLVELLTVIAIICVLLTVVYIMVKDNKDPKALDIKIKCVEGHEYYYFWNGSTYGGPGFAPVLTDEGKPRKCRVERVLQ